MGGKRLTMRAKRNERGVALLICVFALLLVTGIGLAMLASADTETSVNQNYRETQVAYFAARAGIAEAVDRMKQSGTYAIAPPAIMPSSVGGVIYLINKKSSSEVVEPYTLGNAFQDTEICKENFISSVTNNGIGVRCDALPTGTTWYTTVNSYSPFTGTSAALDYKWARLTLKSNSSSYPYYTNGSNSATTAGLQVCSAGGVETTIPLGTSCASANMQPVYVITALAVTPRGTRRMVQTELTKITLPPMPGALTLNGPGGAGATLVPPYDAPNSNPFHINGNNPPGCPGPSTPAIVTTDTATDTRVTNAIPNNRLDHYTGVDGTTPDVTTILPANLDPGWRDPAHIEEIANTLKNAANPANVYTGPQSNINIGGDGVGTNPPPQITYVDGDLTMTGSTRGGGILIVTGTVTMSGNSGFYGIILAIGRGIFQANGGGNGQYDGAIMVAHTRDTNGNVLSTLGNPVVDWSGGGGNGVYYNGCAINNVQNGMGFLTLANRELPY